MHFSFVHAADLHLDAVLPAPDGAENLAVPDGAENLAVPDGAENLAVPGGAENLAVPGGKNGPGQTAGTAGSGQKGGRDLWREAPFLALRRLTDFCIAQGVSLLLLAGDVYDSRQGSLRARLELREAFQRLAEANIAVFWARGNHDPLGEEAAFINWPDNLTIFNSSGQGFLLPWQNGALQKPLPLDETEGAPALPDGPAVFVYGISHAGPRENANLARRLRPVMEKSARIAAGGPDCFRFGLLHCNVGGQADKHENYAPCALSDLTEAPVDYWALGHIHQPEKLAQSPAVVYAGNPQGLHVRESGPRGCWLGRVEAGQLVGQQAGQLAGLDFYNLAALRWERLELDLTLPDQAGQEESEVLPGFEDLEGFILEKIAQLAENVLQDAKSPHCLALLLRVVLGGRSHLDGQLRQGDNLAALTERLNRRLAAEQRWPLQVRLKDLKLKTRPLVSLEAYLARGDLVSETLRQAQTLAQTLAQTPEQADSSILQEYQAALQTLYGHKQVAPWLGDSLPLGADSGLPGAAVVPPDAAVALPGEAVVPPDAAVVPPNEAVALINEAIALCLDLFAVEDGEGVEE